jgi:hypothetical protein
MRVGVIRVRRANEPPLRAQRSMENWLTAEPVPHMKGIRMYLTSRCKRMAAVLVVLYLISASAARAHAHGGGHGGGGGGHGFSGGPSGRGSGGGGFHVSSLGNGWSRFELGSSRFGQFPSEAPAAPYHLSVESPGFPQDLPEARIHRFLEQHLLHPHLLHWLHGEFRNAGPLHAVLG